MARNPKLERVEAQIPKEWKDKLKIIAKKRGLTLSELTRKALKPYTNL